MPEQRLAAGLLLVLGPLVGLLPVGYPPLLGIWTSSRETHLVTVAAHRRAWAMLNAGFGVATILTTAGLVLARPADGPALATVAFDAALVAYGMGGVLWLAVLAMRTRTTPLLAADLCVATLAAADALVAAATGGMFAAFTVITAVALMGVGAAVALAGTPAAVVAGAIAVIVAAIALVTQLRRGDSIPAVLYVPSLVIGVAVLAGPS
jgi:hypothetical protein